MLEVRPGLCCEVWDAPDGVWAMRRPETPRWRGGRGIRAGVLGDGAVRLHRRGAGWKASGMVIEPVRRSFRVVVHPDLLRQVSVFGSQLTLSGSMFLSTFIASLLRQPEEFATLALANSSVALLAMVLDFGMNQNCS